MRKFFTRRLETVVYVVSVLTRVVKIIVKANFCAMYI